MGALVAGPDCSHDIVAPNHAADDQLVFAQDGFTLQLLAPLVVGYSSFVLTSYGPSSPVPAPANVLSPDLVRIDMVWGHSRDVESQVTALAVGQAAIRVVSAIDTTCGRRFTSPCDCPDP